MVLFSITQALARLTAVGHSRKFLKTKELHVYIIDFIGPSVNEVPQKTAPGQGPVRGRLKEEGLASWPRVSKADACSN
jgi:hypothetical protein